MKKHWMTMLTAVTMSVAVVGCGDNEPEVDPNLPPAGSIERDMSDVRQIGEETQQKIAEAAQQGQEKINEIQQDTAEKIADLQEQGQANVAEIRENAEERVADLKEDVQDARNQAAQLLATPRTPTTQPEANK